jgi:ubiquinone/menaquinone biosynthesis C-methylase UbiE
MAQTTETIRTSGWHFLVSPRRSDEPELMDEGAHDAAVLAANLRDIRRVNHLLGGTKTTLRHLPALFHQLPGPEPVSLLDLGTGSGDIPIAIAAWANAQQRPVRIVASDAAPAMLDIARELVAPWPAISLARYDARNVPLPDQAVDIVLCSLSLHHFSPDDAVLVLREMHRLARTGFILNDLRRSRTGYVAAWIAARLTTRNRYTRNDAPLSVQRAYTPAELDDLLARAGITNARITQHRWFRMAAVWNGAADHG